jgi:hypothetical protein
VPRELNQASSILLTKPAQRTRGKERQPLIEVFQDLAKRQQANSRRGSLQGQRRTVQAHAAPRNGLRVVIMRRSAASATSSGSSVAVNGTKTKPSFASSGGTGRDQRFPSRWFVTGTLGVSGRKWRELICCRRPETG